MAKRLEYAAFLGGIIAIIAFSSLLLHVYQTQDARSLSYTWLILNSSAQLLVLVYGVANASYGIYIPASIFVVGLLYIAYVKVKNRVTDNAKSKKQ